MNSFRSRVNFVKYNKKDITITHLYACVTTPVSFCKEVDVKQYPSVTQVSFLSAQISQWHSNPETIKI
jgi:hypothetical protein